MRPWRFSGQAVAGVAEPGLLAVPLAGEPGLRVGGRAVRRVAALLAAPVDLGVAAAAAWRRRILLLALGDGPQALQRGGRLEKRAVEREVLAAEELVRANQRRSRLYLSCSQSRRLEGIAHEDLGELGTQEVLGSDRGAVAAPVERIDGRLHLAEGTVDQRADGARRVVARRHVLERGHDDEPGLPLFASAHRHRCPPRGRLPGTVVGSPGRGGHPPEGSS